MEKLIEDTLFYSYHHSGTRQPMVTVCLKLTGGTITRGLSICSLEEPIIRYDDAVRRAEGRAKWAYGRFARIAMEVMGVSFDSLDESTKKKMDRYKHRPGIEIVRERAKKVMDQCQCPFTLKAYYMPILTNYEKTLARRKGWIIDY